MKAKVLLLTLVVTIAAQGVTFPYKKMLDMSRMPFYSQQNSAWSGDQIGLGGCGETIGSSGCFITATAMGLKYYGKDYNPKTFNIWLKQHNGYDMCNFRWITTQQLYQNFNKPEIQILADQIAFEIDQGNPVIAATDAGGSHWYVIVGYERTEDGELSWWINDPWKSSGPTKSTYSLLGGNYRLFSAPENAMDIVGYFPGSISITTDLFRGAYTSDLGFPVDNGGGTAYIHNWNGCWIQDFRTPDGKIKHLVHNKFEFAVHLIQGANAGYWFSHFGELGSYPPIGEEISCLYVGQDASFISRGTRCVFQEFGITPDVYPQKTIVWNSVTKFSNHFPVGYFEVAVDKVPSNGNVIDITNGGRYVFPKPTPINGKYQFLLGAGFYKLKIVDHNDNTLAYLEHTVTEGNDQVWDPNINIPPTETPILSVSQTNFNFGDNYNQFSFQVGNNGTGILNWSSATYANWLSFSPTSGSLVAGQSITVYLNLNRSLLSADNNSATPSIYSNGGNETLSAQATGPNPPPIQPVLSITPSTLDFGENLTELTLNISNSGNGSLEWSSNVSVLNLQLSPSYGTDNTVVTVAASRDNLIAQTHNETIFITSNGGNFDIPVRIVKTETPPPPPVIEYPSLWLSTDNLYFDTITTEQYIVIRNSGTGTLRWSVTSDKTWASASATFGDLSAGAQVAIIIYVDKATLSTGDSNANFYFSGNGGDKNLLITATKAGYHPDDPPDIPPPPIIYPSNLYGTITCLEKNGTLGLIFTGEIFDSSPTMKIKSDNIDLDVKEAVIKNGDCYTMSTDYLYLNFVWVDKWFYPGWNNCLITGDVEWIEFTNGGWFKIIRPITKIFEKETMSRNFSLSIYPNPFNNSTMISISLPEPTTISLVVYNSLGQKIYDLANGQYEAGEYIFTFSADNLPSGIYFCFLQTEKFCERRKMLLVR
ncbi:MAG: C39 family peptidase [Lutibacter sp.]|jgi:hypothetical protein